MNDFSIKLTDSRLDSLEARLREFYIQLSRKDDVIKDIRINKKTFTAKLLDKEGNTIKKKSLSSGERQVFALSLLWALAKSSQLSLPIVIDTPLGRLDSHHRKNLVDHYFPHASRQMIILSTDTEFDESYYKLISKWVSHAYELDYDSKERKTIINEGYFWRGTKKKA